MKKKLLALGLTFAMVFSMAACGGDDGGDASAKTSIVVYDGEWYGLDTYQLSSTAGAQSLNSSSLFQWDPETNTVEDNVCTNWQVSDDGKTATFDVPEGMYYSTGEQVEPEDVVASLEHGLEVSPYSDGYDNIKSMDIDGRTVTLHLSGFRSNMLYYLCAGFIIVIDKDELDTMDNDELMWNCHPYGMYSLAEGGYISGSEIQLVRNDKYTCANPLAENKGAGKFETISVRFNVEEFTETEELKNGTADIITGVSGEQKQEMEGNDNITLVDASYPTVTFFELNTSKGIFEDINVRKAMILSIDRDELVEVTDGMIAPAYSLIIESMQNYNADASAYFEKNLANNPEEAKKLLEDAGWKDTDGDGIREKDGKKLSFTWYTWSSATRRAEKMSAQLKEVGFDMQIETLEWNYMYEKIESDDYDAGIRELGWAEPILIFNACYKDPNAPGKTDAYFKKVAETTAETDTDKRTEKVGELQMHIFENIDLVPLCAELSFEAYNSSLKNYTVLKDGTHVWNDLTY